MEEKTRKPPVFLALDSAGEVTAMPAKQKARRAAKKAEAELSGVGRSLKKRGRAVENELKKGGRQLKNDAKKLKKKL